MPPRPAAPDRLHRSHEVELLATRFPGAKGLGDLVFFEGPKGGAAFSVGSIAWAAVLATDGYDNDVARLTTNVLRRVAVTIHELGAYIHELRESVCGDATDLPAHVLQDFLDGVATGDATVPIHRTYRLDEIATAHADMEAGRATGKLVVLP